MKKKWVLLFYAALFLFVLGCGQDKGRDASSKKDELKPSLTVGLMPDTDSVPFIIAREKGFFAAEGVEVTLQQFKSAMDRDAAMQSGKLDGAVSDLLAAAFALEGGFDVCATSLTDGNYLLVTGKESNVADVRMLDGSEVAVSRNTIIEYVTDRILAANGMSSDTIQKVSVPQIPARLEMLQNGKLTAATLPEPMASIAVANGCKYLTGANNLGINPGVMVFSMKAAREKKEALQAMYRAYNRSVDYINNTPKEQYIDLIVDKGGFPEAARNALSISAYHAATLPKEKDVAEVMHWLKEKGLIKKEHNYQEIVLKGCLP